MPRVSPVPSTAPTDPVSAPPGARSGENQPTASGASTANPIGSVDHVIVWLIANTRPWNRCGTLTCTSVA